MPVWSVVSGFIPYLIGVARIEKSWYLKLGQFDGTSTTRAGQMKWTTHEQAEPNRTFLVFVVGIFLKENFHVDQNPGWLSYIRGLYYRVIKDYNKPLVVCTRTLPVLASGCANLRSCTVSVTGS